MPQEWNARVSVVGLVEADSERAAVDTLKARLRAAGFQVYDGDKGDAFESEDQCGEIDDTAPHPTEES